VPKDKGLYGDENLTEEEEESGRLRQPAPQEARPEPEKETKPVTLNPDRPDEFGDGDRRS
jgi:hypothetical protein